MTKEIELEDTDLDRLYIIRYDFMNQEETFTFIRELKKEFPDKFFIAAPHGMELSVCHYKNDGKVQISEVV